MASRSSANPMIYLDPLQPSHAGEMYEGLQQAAGYEFLPDDPPTDISELTARYTRQCGGGSANGAERWYNWIIRHQEGNRALGYTQATLRARVALIAYHVFPSSWRLGVGLEAVSKTIAVVFGMSDVDEVVAEVDTRNAASIALLTRLGFERTHFLERADFFKGQQSDEWRFELHRIRWSG